MWSDAGPARRNQDRGSSSTKLRVTGKSFTGQLRTLAPAMPQKVQSLLHEEFNDLDPEADRMLSWMRSARVFHEFAHARAPFVSHLRGTWGMLACWNQPEETCRCGLLHSAYTRDGFYFRYFDILSQKSRDHLASVLGPEAELQIYKYCASSQLWRDSDLVPASAGKHIEACPPSMVILGQPLPPDGVDSPTRMDPSKTVHLSARDLANYLVVLVADVAEQMCPVFTYRDVYHPSKQNSLPPLVGDETGDRVPQTLWPGKGEPVSGMFAFFSLMLKSAAPYLDNVPRVFNNCTEIIDFNDDRMAQKAYWQAVQGEGKLPGAALEELYHKAIEHNPWIAEPHVMLSQLLYNRGSFAEAIHHAAEGLQIFYDWATQWDKRVDWAQWVGFARNIILRSTRKQQALKALPSRKLSPTSDPDETEPTYLQDMVAGFEATTEKQSQQTSYVAQSKL